MPHHGDDANARLEAALIAVADVLAELPPAEFDRLCRQETAEWITRQQFHDAFGVPDAMPPELLIGSRIVRLFVERHPEVATDVTGEA